MYKKITLFLVIWCQINRIISEETKKNNYDFVFPDSPILSDKFKDSGEETENKCECVVYFSCTDTDGAGKLDIRFKGDEQCPGYPYFRCCNINKERTQLISKSKFPKKEETYKQKATRVYTKSLGKSQTFRSKRSPQNLVSWITNQAANIINNPLQNVLGFSHNQIFQNQQQLMWPTTVNSGFNQPQYFLGQTNTNTVPVYNQLSLGENYPPSYLTPDFPGQSVIYNPQTIVTTSPGIISVVPEENLDTNFGYSLPNQINTTPQILPVVTKQNYVENTTPVSKPTDPSPAQDIDSVFDITKPNKEKGDQKTLDEIFNVKNDNKPSLENKSRQVLKDADGDECTCVVYYQCREETGQIITDGTGILDVRFDPESTKLCPNDEQAVCCKLPKVKN